LSRLAALPFAVQAPVLSIQFIPGLGLGHVECQLHSEPSDQLGLLVHQALG